MATKYITATVSVLFLMSAFAQLRVRMPQ